MKAKDMREKPLEDLRELEKSLMHDHFFARLKNFTNRLDDTSMLRKLRRDRARVITLLREMTKGGKLEGKPAAKPAKPAVPAAPKSTPKAAPSKPAVAAAPPSKPAAAAKPRKAAEAKAKAEAPSKGTAKKRSSKTGESEAK